MNVNQAPNKLLFLAMRICMLSIIAWFCGCCKNIVVDDKTNGRSTYVRLQNQTEHSGIMVRLRELDRFVTTDSTGYFQFDSLREGSYTLEAKYPYFRSEQQTITVEKGKISTPVDLELKQLLQFWIEPAETTISMSNLGNPDWFTFERLRQYRVNITNEPVIVSTIYAPPNLWALVPQGFEWPYVANPYNRLDLCYEEYNWFGGNELSYYNMLTFQPSDTSFAIVPKPGSFLAKICVKAGKYLFYSAASDFGNYPDYFKPDYFWIDTLSYPQPFNQLNKTLLRKLDLFRPAAIHFIE